MLCHQQDASEAALKRRCHCGATGGLIRQTPAGSWPQMLADWSRALPGQLSGSPLISYNTDERPSPQKPEKQPHTHQFLHLKCSNWCKWKQKSPKQFELRYLDCFVSMKLLLSSKSKINSKGSKYCAYSFGSFFGFNPKEHFKEPQDVSKNHNTSKRVLPQVKLGHSQQRMFVSLNCSFSSEGTTSSVTAPQ